jgi:isopenicillin N synthase-like dioxygenase
VGHFAVSAVPNIPVVDLTGFEDVTGAADRVAAEIGEACRNAGFFYVVGHGVDQALQQRLEAVSRAFFAQETSKKLEIAMERGGRAWRGYFPVGAELTSGRPDQKEGLYFGSELEEDHPKVVARVPLHGRNLFPDVPGFRTTVLAYMDAMTRLGHTLMRGVALSLGLEGAYFDDRYTRDPLILFRIFNYPALATPQVEQELWSVGEHTDYGLLTILRQDDSGGLQVKTGARWLDAPPIPGSFVCNIGDMLDRMTGGLYRSTPHRVRNASGRSRLSFPFFFDPSFDAEVKQIDTGVHVDDDRAERWDHASVHEFQGTYGDYVLKKVSKVFPELGEEAL